MKNILFICLMMFSGTFFSSCGDKKIENKASKDTITVVKTDSIKPEVKKDTIQKVIEKKDTTSTVRQTEKTQVEEP